MFASTAEELGKQYDRVNQEDENTNLTFTQQGISVHNFDLNCYAFSPAFTFFKVNK